MQNYHDSTASMCNVIKSLRENNEQQWKELTLEQSEDLQKDDDINMTGGLH